jgi:hypothetical protein
VVRSIGQRNRSREKLVFEELTQAEKEYMKFVDSQVQILQDTVDTILNNVVKYHDEVCPEPKEICRENYTQIFH